MQVRKRSDEFPRPKLPDDDVLFPTRFNGDQGVGVNKLRHPLGAELFDVTEEIERSNGRDLLPRGRWRVEVCQLNE
jgi:hypothetical protein